ncbi:hypothetical protein SL003B_3600 [Polymorphum gilvum SL003B-26A1]|uniref:Uncharacterized protein n=1 Tax=Polymorphum gilvum (strain LMG 25793 / CGMCC 1.9160 / SL003B-26A1) TaxID=991905 RepID=F2J1W1_POLGS|nr:hypothetical protein SL003B_3600 [Polymorphum gilvum SL003B-26A1]
MDGAETLAFEMSSNPEIAAKSRIKAPIRESSAGDVVQPGFPLLHEQQVEGFFEKGLNGGVFLRCDHAKLTCDPRIEMPGDKLGADA